MPIHIDLYIDAAAPEQMHFPGFKPIAPHRPRENFLALWLKAFHCSLTHPPLAALLALGADLPGEDWLCADPVHLRVDLTGMYLLTHDQLLGNEQAANQAFHTLAHHLQQDGMELVALDAQHWLVKLNKPLAITTTPLYAATHLEISGLLPQGPDALAWHRLLTELQILLQPLGLAMNSVWFWGEGALPAAPKVKLTQIVGQHLVLHALAKWASVAQQNNVENFILPQQAGHYLIYTHSPEPLLATLLNALRKRQIDALQINFPHLQFNLTQNDLRWGWFNFLL